MGVGWSRMLGSSSGFLAETIYQHMEGHVAYQNSWHTDALGMMKCGCTLDWCPVAIWKYEK